MAQNVSSSSTTAKQAKERGTQPSDVAALLAKVHKLLEAEDIKQALDLLLRTRSASLWSQNAIGVCQLRLGQTQAAIALFRGMVVSETLLVRDHVPTVCRTNFATALLVSRNIPGCVAVLSELTPEDHPTVVKLNDAIKRWKSNLTLWQKIQWYTGTELNHAVELGFPPGDLE